MAHYAFLNDENIVTEVIVGIEENETIEGLSPEEWYANFREQKCLRTSYNGKIRFNFAGIGYFYNEALDGFIPPKCHEEALLNESNCLWTCINSDHDERFDVEI
jgi:hypothetical protein